HRSTRCSTQYDGTGNIFISHNGINPGAVQLTEKVRQKNAIVTGFVTQLTKDLSGMIPLGFCECLLYCKIYLQHHRMIIGQIRIAIGKLTL
ncbi:MAG: hypothetical protein IPP49_16770, partial [Saprospiraceae bacterium]|nr:hypothetical protein [Saprospiraceae bacterium]